jgi:hypothetical protein
MLSNVLRRGATMTIILDFSDSLFSKIKFALASQKASVDCLYGRNPAIHEQESSWENATLGHEMCGHVPNLDQFARVSVLDQEGLGTLKLVEVRRF